MVDEQFSDAVYIDFLEPKENRYIDGVPIDEFCEHQNEQKYKNFQKDGRIKQSCISSNTEMIPKT